VPSHSITATAKIFNPVTRQAQNRLEVLMYEQANAKFEEAVTSDIYHVIEATLSPLSRLCVEVLSLSEAHLGEGLNR